MDAAKPIAELLQAGGPYGLCALLMVALGALWRAYTASQNARIAEGMEMARDATKALGDSSKGIAAMSVAVENTNRLNEQRLEALRDMTSAIAAVAEDVKRIEGEQRRLSDRLSTGGRA